MFSVSSRSLCLFVMLFVSVFVCLWRSNFWKPWRRKFVFFWFAGTSLAASDQVHISASLGEGRGHKVTLKIPYSEIHIVDNTLSLLPVAVGPWWWKFCGGVQRSSEAAQNHQTFTVDYLRFPTRCRQLCRTKVVADELLLYNYAMIKISCRRQEPVIMLWLRFHRAHRLLFGRLCYVLSCAVKCD